ncbi:MAG: T9SS type A sorting domain-containing protein [Tannerellaceae bacterium]|jgi:hypothetical protein|nr:T9SS type A sorting domain-containing protein [Tannerellaceae bacterium]
MKQTIAIIGILFFLSAFHPATSASRSSIPDDPINPIPCVQITPASVYVYMDKFNSRPTREIRIDNSGGKLSVSYNASLRFIRSLSDWEGLSEQDNESGSGVNKPSGSAASPTQFLQYETLLGYAFGENSSKPQTFATKYRAGAAGFKASSVGTWFTGDISSEGVIHVEIRAGGASINDAVPLATGSLDFSVRPEEVNGKMYSIPLSKPAAVYPGEDFYVIVTYPVRQKRPQGCAMNPSVESVPGRYLLKSGTGWLDLQQMEGFSRCAWLMSVTETERENIAWLRISSASSGTVGAGRISSLYIMYEGSAQLKGERKAEVILTAGDSCLTRVSIPVTLHVNEAPFFLQAPSAIYVPENSVQQYEIKLYDNEDDSFTVEPLEGAKVVHHALSDSLLTLTVSPQAGDAGNYSVKFRITDEHGESRVLNIPVHVIVLEELFDPNQFVYSIVKGSVTYNIRDLFRIVNGDEFSFLVTSLDENIVKVEQPDDSTVVIIPDGLGTTSILFDFRDNYGNVLSRVISVSVGPCEDPSLVIVQKWNSVLLVNNFGNKYMENGYQWYKNKQAIPGATGQYYSGEDAGGVLDFTAAYHVRFVTVSGDTVYSCPLTPVARQEAKTKVYPNPIRGGEVLTVETGFTDMGEDVHVQLIDFAGRIIQTGSFKVSSGTFRVTRANSGYYLLLVSGKKGREAFTVYVK